MKLRRYPRAGSGGGFMAGSMIGLLCLLFAGSPWAQGPAPAGTATGTTPAGAPAPVQGERASSANPVEPMAPVQRDAASDSRAIKAAPPLRGEVASGVKPVKAPIKPGAKSVHGKPAKASRKAIKPRTASKPADRAKARPAPAKKPVTVKPKAPARKKPVAAAAADASKAAPGADAAPAPQQAAVPPPLGAREAEARYREGVELERRGDLRGAHAAYSQAGENGNADAQKKLGDFYGTGNDVVERDYETSLRWYERARAQGIEVRKPFTYPGVRR